MGVLIVVVPTWEVAAATRFLETVNEVPTLAVASSVTLCATTLPATVACGLTRTLLPDTAVCEGNSIIWTVFERDALDVCCDVLRLSLTAKARVKAIENDLPTMVPFRSE